MASAEEFFIVDNSDEHWKALEYLKEWCEISESIDIATGYFEIGALLRLEGKWQKVDKIRILIGSEQSRQTVETIRRACEVLNSSLANEILDDPFLIGLDSVIEAIRVGKIEIRVYKSRKFHAKAYITHGKLQVVGSAALVGSSNFTPAGLTRNIELNVRFTGPEVRELQAWFETYWEQGESITEDILKVLDRFERKYTPLEIYAKALSTLTRDVEPSASEWERESSKIYPMLAPYQREAYHGLKQRASKWRGAFLTDGVGLGKTFVGLMLAEYFASKERRKVLILASKTGVESVWGPELKLYLPHLTGAFASVEVMAHTDFSKKNAMEKIKELAERVDVIIIDEAHNFRNRGSKGDDPNRPKSRWWRLQEVAKGKTVFNLTATPINNSLRDLVHQIEIFSGRADDHFASVGVPSLNNHVQALENEFARGLVRNPGVIEQRVIEMQDFETLIQKSPLLDELVVQNSRAYAVSSSIAEEQQVKFPETAMPRAIPYEYTMAFDNLLDELRQAFSRTNPLFVLPMYYPLAFARVVNPNDPWVNRQKQVVALIRTIFLKRFESSIAAFSGSCLDLADKIAQWIHLYSESMPSARDRILQWESDNAQVRRDIHDLFRPDADFSDIEFEDDVDPFEIDSDEVISDADYKLEEMLDAAFDDLEQLTKFLRYSLMVGHDNDDKLVQLISLLTGKGVKDRDPVVFDKEFANQKVLVFTEFADTARYIHSRLQAAGVSNLDRLDGSRKTDRGKMIKRFAPYYNKVSDVDRAALSPLRVLVSTDVLSEGVNLQDATMVVNYDIHWNPVRLMQRIGRVDRRLNPEIESLIIAEHPNVSKTRGIIFIRNFLPPEALNDLLSLYSRVQGRAVLISKTLGIPGGRLLNAEDLLDDVKVFKAFQDEYQGQISVDEQLRLDYLQLLKAHPELAEVIETLPNGAHTSKAGEPLGIFECSIEPIKTAATDDSESVWTTDEGRVRWSFVGKDGTKSHDFGEISQYIKSTISTERLPVSDRIVVAKSIKDLRTKQIEQLQKDSGLPMDAPRPIPICWMEIQ
jgi:superfamily II DNA or RNA helicase